VKSAHGAGTEIRAEIKLPALRRFTATASD
jgi:hypothetical protein